MTTRRAVGILAATTLIATVILANWLTSTFHFVPVGFGYEATAGTFAAGFALAARDALQDAVGKRWMLATLAIAAAVSYAVADPHIATASAIAFLVAELLDFAVYTPIRRKSRLGDKRWATAVIASDAVGIVTDTVVFIGIAFGWAAVLPAMAGQLVGKAWATLAYLVLGKVTASAVLRQPNRQSEGA